MTFVIVGLTSKTLDLTADSVALGRAHLVAHVDEANAVMSWNDDRRDGGYPPSTRGAWPSHSANSKPYVKFPMQFKSLPVARQLVR